jgi:hypothetical protein
MSLFRYRPARRGRRRTALAATAALGVAAALLTLPGDAASAATATVPHAATAAVPTSGAAAHDPLFGVNMSFYDAHDHLATDSATQALFRDWGTPMVRVPLRDAFDGGAKVTDGQLLTAMRAVRTVGATPVLVLRGPGGGRDEDDIRSTDLHLLDLVHQVFGDGAAYLEFGNEPDLASVDPEEYADAWNAVVPALKSRYPDAGYRYAGPVTSRVDHESADYVGTFVRLARPAPDVLSWHEYLCDTTVSGWQDTCTAHLANWQTHVDGVEDRVRAATGHTLGYLVSEWNIDPRDTGPVYTREANAGYLAAWTRTALRTLHRLDPAPEGALLYTATDHGNFALVKGSTTPTAQGTAFHAAMADEDPPGQDPTDPPGDGGVTAGFEDGTTQGWSGYYGDADPAVTTGRAYEGTHALRFTLSPDGHTGIGTDHGLDALAPGDTVTYHVYADRPGTTVTPFVRDDDYRAVQAAPVALPAGQWTTVTWTVPDTDSVGALGLDASAGTGTVTVDALTWPTS